jgi:hypothetical protein
MRSATTGFFSGTLMQSNSFSCMTRVCQPDFYALPSIELSRLWIIGKWANHKRLKITLVLASLPRARSRHTSQATHQKARISTICHFSSIQSFSQSWCIIKFFHFNLRWESFNGSAPMILAMTYRWSFFPFCGQFQFQFSRNIYVLSSTDMILT